MKFTITFKKNLVKSFLNRRNRILNIENNLVWSCLLAETGVACEMEGGRQTNWYVSPKLIFHPVYLLFRICHPTTKQTVTSYNHSHIFTWNKIVTKITAVLARYMSDVSSWTHKLKSRMYIYVQYKDVFIGIYMIYLFLHCECQLHYWASSRAIYYLKGKYI